MRMITFKCICLACVSVLTLNACSGDGTEFKEAAEANNLKLNSLTIHQPAGLITPLVVNVGERIPLTISGISDDNELLEISEANRSWFIDPASTSFASIDSNGQFLALADSGTPLNVFINIGGVSTSFPILIQTEALASITEIRGPASLERCLPQNYQAIGTFSAGSLRGLPDAGWSVANPIMGRVGESDEGSIPVVGLNTTAPLQLVAAFDGESFSRDITVLDNLQQIVITPEDVEMRVDRTLSLGATGTYTTGESERSVVITDLVEWAVSEGNGIVSVENEDPKGQLTSSAVGTTLVSASCGDKREEKAVVVTGGGTILGSSSDSTQ